MSGYSYDYNNSATACTSCAYGSLGNYNSNYSMGVPPMGKPSAGAYVVPTYSPPSYDTLIAKVPSPSGYFNITTAYGQGAGNCQQTYTTSLCGSG